MISATYFARKYDTHTQRQSEAVKIITREQNIKEHKVTESIFISV